MTSSMASAITQFIFSAIVRYCSSKMCKMYCARSGDRCHAQLRNSDAPKIKSAPIELKIGTGMFSPTPDTMAMSVLRQNDVITLPLILLICYVKNQSAQIALKILTFVVWKSPDTMTVLVFRNCDVITLPLPLAHLLHENLKFSDCAEFWHRRSLDTARFDDDDHS